MNLGKAWGILLIARPLVLVPPFFSWLMGVGMAYYEGFDVQTLGVYIGLAAMLLTVASIHYVNEYADFETDELTVRTPYSGGSGAIKSGLVNRKTALTAGSITLVLGLGLGAYSLLNGNTASSAIVILVLGAFGGWMYSLRPLKLAWRGLGEIDNALLGGILLPIYGYSTAAGAVKTWVIVASIPFTLLVFANLLAVTWPDRKADRAAGKFTLATMWTPSRLKILFGAVNAAAYVILLSLNNVVVPTTVMYAGLLALPFTIHGSMYYTRNLIASSTVWAMMVMVIFQDLAWFYVHSISPIFL